MAKYLLVHVQKNLLPTVSSKGETVYEPMLINMDKVVNIESKKPDGELGCILRYETMKGVRVKEELEYFVSFLT